MANRRWPSLLFVLGLSAALGCAAAQTDAGKAGTDTAPHPNGGTGSGRGPSTGQAGTLMIAVGGSAGSASSGGGTGPVTKEQVIGHAVEAPAWNCGEGCFTAAGLTSADAAAFDKAAIGGTPPTLLYPLAGALYPVNLPEITVQWRRASAAQTLFRIELLRGAVSYRFYTPCVPIAGATADECGYTIPEAEWFDLTFASRGSKLDITVAATDGGKSALAKTTAIPFHVSEYPVTGGLYYWSTANRGTYRLVFGAKQADPFIEPLTKANPTECGGCHAVSRDGSTIAFTQGTADGGYLTVAPTLTPDAPRVAPGATTKHDSSMVALSPDGKRSVTAFKKDMTQQVLELRDTANGRLIRSVSAADWGGKGAPFFPEFSPDGHSLALTLSGDPVVEWSVRQGSIAIMPFDPATDTFGAPEVIVEGGNEMHFYPSWSPDGKWLAFASAPAGMGRASYDQAQARLRMVSLEDKKIYELGHATQKAGLTSTWPKFAPFLDKTGNVMYITFNSKLDYGAALKNSEQQQDQQRPQLWMAGIDLRNLASGDPSFAPVWLPFQQVDQNNHLGYWTEKVICSLESGCGGNAQLQCVFGAAAGDPGRCTVVK